MKEWILYDSYSDYFKANLMLSKLQQEGFNCFLENENTVTNDPMLGNAIGGIRLMVLQKDADAILAIQKEWIEEAKKNHLCPKCGAFEIESITKQTTGNYLFAIFSSIMANFAVAASCYQCKLCNHRFENMA